MADPLSEAFVLPQVLRFDTTNGLAGLLDQVVEFVIGTDVEFSKPAKELGQVVDGRVSKDLLLAIRTVEPLAEVGN